MIDFQTLNVVNNKQRITQAEKDSNDGQWYKRQADLLDSTSFSQNHFIGIDTVTEYKRKKVNYDLFNNIVNLKDFEYVCKPYGANTGELPANMTNRDIISGKIKVLLGMEMKMPFSWKVVAVNEDATTRREQEEFKRIQQFVTAEIMKPIQQQIKAQVMAQQKGKQLTPAEQQQLQQQIDQQTQAQTPDEVRKYMTEKHQDPAEMMMTQILEYLVLKEKVAEKFNKGWKHSNISGEEIYCVNILNGEPSLTVINSLFFDYDKSPDLDYIEDGEWAACEYRMTPSEVVANFGSELSEKDIDRIYMYQNNPSHIYNMDFTFEASGTKKTEPYTIRVMHLTWKSLRKIGYLTFKDQTSPDSQMKLVDENYKLNKAQGDIKIEWEWIPEAHETYKIMSDIYVHKRPVLGQHKDLDNLWVCKLPYYGAACDNLNSITTSPMDRMKPYQYFYNIIIYRIELLMASDKGKIIAANINAIPKSAGLDIDKWTYFMEANKIAWFNPNEEGNRGGQDGNVTNFVKEIDMSLASQINQYIELAEYIEKKCGESVGITKQMEGAIGPNEAVTNTKQNLVQSSHIIQPYFEQHNNVKGNVLTALVEKAKVAYSTGKPRKLNYVLDDMSYRMLTVDPDLLDSSTYGLFISNSSKANDAKQAVENLAQAALQNQQADLVDIIKVIRSESVTEAEELLEAAASRKQDQAQASQQADQAAKQQEQQQEQLHEQQQWKHEEDMVTLKAKEDRETKIQVATISAMGYDINKDEDDDGIPDTLEVAKFGVDADIKKKKIEQDNRKLDLEERKFTHQKITDKAKIEIDRKKASQKTTSK